MFNIHIFNKKVKMQSAIINEKKKYLKLHEAKKSIIVYSVFVRYFLERDVVKVGVYRKRVETFVMNVNFLQVRI